MAWSYHTHKPKCPKQKGFQGFGGPVGGGGGGGAMNTSCSSSPICWGPIPMAMYLSYSCCSRSSLFSSSYERNKAGARLAARPAASIGKYRDRLAAKGGKGEGWGSVR